MFFVVLLLISQLDEILRDTTLPCFGEEHLGALTAAERTTWSDTREKYFLTGINRTSLETIEKAAFVLILDDEEYHLGVVSTVVSP
jgi:carnitine O-palmitoyltransferase 1, liver isoform